MSKSSLVAALALISFVLSGCGGSGGAGEQKKPDPPVAWAKALNHPFERTGGDISLRVRAGADVLLSGADSNGTSVPVIRYKWTVSQAPAGTPLALLKRTESAVSFQAPAVATRTTLQLKLLVTDSNGATDEAMVTVAVEPVTDPNAFLTYGNVAQTYTVAAVTSSAVAVLVSDVRFAINVERSVSYTDIAGIRHDNFALGSETLQGAWLQATGTGGSDATCGGPQNPRFTLAMPALNADEILAKLTDDQIDRALDPALIDTAVVTVKLTLTPETALPAAAGVPGICVLGPANALLTASAKPTVGRTSFAESGTASAQKTVTLDQLLGDATRLYDTRASAEAYYRTIDPDTDAYTDKQTFSGWLRRAGFTNGTQDWDAIAAAPDSAHAVYLNNFDLGFGRDMYMRVGTCDGGAKPMLGGTIDPGMLGQCDVYGVVVNYGSLEAAAKKLGPVLAVAMEYSRIKPGAPRVTKFYTYAPDRKGGYSRVLSANLDGRGEKFLPGACTVCHGGTPQGIGTADANGDGRKDYGNSGDVNSGFIAWDLDAFLYSDTDPAFSRAGDPFFPELEQRLAADLTRDKQAQSLRKLNQMAYLTYADPPGQDDRFALARELVTGWYGGVGLPNAGFDGGFVPVGWRDDANDVPGGKAAVYKGVFAQHCRACHVSQQPGVINQLAIGSYAELFNDAATAAKLRDALGDGRMPFARLTMDRFWVSSKVGTDSAANILAKHMLQSGAAFATPGATHVCIDPDIAGDKAIQITNRASWVLPTAGCSRSVGTYTWSLLPPAGSQSVLVGADTATPRFLPDKEGDYRVTLTVGAETDVLTASLADAKPQVDAAPIVLPIALVAGAGSGTVDLEGRYSSRDAVTSVSVKQVANVTNVTPTITPVPGAPARVTLAVSTNTLKAGFVRFTLVDEDGDESGIAQIDTIPSTDAPAARPLAFELDANGSGTVNLWPDTAPVLSQIYGVTTGPILGGANGTTGSTNPAAGAAAGTSTLVAYTAPRGIATHFGALNLRSTAGNQLRERFGYQVCYEDSPGNCSTNVVDVKIRATQSLAALAAQLRSSCAGCHADTRLGSNLVIKATAAEQSDAKLRCTLVAGVSTVGSSAVRESQGTEAAGTPYLTLAAGGTGSLLYQKASGLQSHHGDGLTNAAWPLALIRTWIDEGALDTADVDPTCADGGSSGSEPVAPSSSTRTVEVTWSATAKSRTLDLVADLGWANPKGVVIQSVTSPGVSAQAAGGEITVTLDTDLRGGTVTYSVLRSDGTSAGTGTLIVDADAPMSLLTPGFTRTLTFAAPLSSTFSLTAAATASATPTDLAKSCTVTFTGTLGSNPGGTKATLTQAAPGSCSVTYDAPAGTITHFGSQQVNAPDTFGYSICWAGSTGDDCAGGTGTMRINGTVSFAASVNPILTSVCTSCHSGDFPSGGMKFGDALPPAAGYAPSVNYTTLHAVTDPLRVTRGDPDNSLAYLYPAGARLTTHSAQGTAEEVALIRKWIAEGAYCTGC